MEQRIRFPEDMVDVSREVHFESEKIKIGGGWVEILNFNYNTEQSVLFQFRNLEEIQVGEEYIYFEVRTSEGGYSVHYPENSKESIKEVFSSLSKELRKNKLGR